MRRILLTSAISCFAFLSGAQSLVPIPDSYETPVIAAVCEETSRFKINTLHAPTLPNGNWPSSFTLSLQIFVVSNVSLPYNPTNINYPWNGGFPNCTQNITGMNPVEIRNITFGGAGFTFPTNAQWNVATQMYDFPVTLHPPTPTHGNPIEHIEYTVYLDCNLKSISGGSLSIVQKWYYSGGTVTTPTLLPTQPMPVPVTSPNIVPVLPVPGSQFITVSAPYNPTGNSDWYFVFQNNGTADANIRVSQFLTDVCGSYTAVGSLQYAISTIAPATSNSMTILSGGLPWTTLAWNNFIVGQTLPPIQMNEYLYIKQSVIINNCINSCNAPPAATPPQMHFSWQCAKAVVPDNCPECQQDYNIELRFNKGVESYKIHRVAPTDAVAELNKECQGDDEIWVFEVENTGAAVLPTIDVRFYNPLVTRSLSMISSDLGPTGIELTAPASNPNCISLSPTQPPISFTPAFTTCGSFPNNPTSDFHVSISGLRPTETCTIRFKVKNIPSDDETYFLNADKYYNQWRIQSVCTTACNTLINPDYTNSIQPNSYLGISGYSINNPLNEDLDLHLNFFPIINNITVPNQGTTPYYAHIPTFYHIDMNGLAGSIEDLQALGYTQASALPQISGIIKATINCQQGLSISNPNNVFFAVPNSLGGYVQLRSIYNDGFCTPVLNTFVTTPLNVGGVPINNIYDANNCSCGTEEYTLYFRISDLLGLGIANADLPNLFTQGKFIFGLTACCTALGQSDYAVKFSLLPNEDCFSFSTINGACTVTGQGAVCCWLPLSSKGGKISVHCPGCLAPGVIVDNYKMSRTTYGYPDVTNDGVADITGTGNEIDYYPGQTSSSSPYSKYGQLEWYKSGYGDELEDYMVAHFEDGDNNYGGYQYGDMFSGTNGVDLDVVQLFRSIKNSGISEYNVQLTGFDFYIDADVRNSSTPAPLDADMFDQLIGTPTLLHKYVPLSGLTYVLPSGNTLYERKTPPNDHEMVFTFTEADLQYLFTTQPAGITVSLTNGWSMPADIDYMPWQQYRLRARYKVCGNKQSTTANTPDEGEVQDFMYLKTAPVPLNQLTVGVITSNQMKNSAAEVYNLGIQFYTSGMQCTGCQPPAPNTNQACISCAPITDANYADNYFFYCEPNGGMHYFLSTDCRNSTEYVRPNNASYPNCQAYVQVYSTATYMRNIYPNQCFKYEYKPPHLFQTDFTLKEPAEWDWLTVGGHVQMDLTSFNCGFWNCVQYAIGSNNNVSPSSTLNINTNSAFASAFPCLTTASPTDAFIADEASFQRLRVYLTPENCSNFTVPPNPLPVNMLEDSKITFADNLQSCTLPMAAGCSYTLDPVKNENPNSLTLPPPNPNLAFNIAPGVYSANSGTVTWHFTLSNFATQAFPTPTEAKNVYIAFNSAAIPTFLGTSFNVTYGDFVAGTTPVTYPLSVGITGNYFWLTPNGTLNQLAAGHFFEGDITVNVVNCSALPSTIDFAWGWNCFNETQPPPSASLCYEETATVTLNSVPGTLSTYTNAVPPDYTACDATAQQVEACFRNLTPVELAFPQTVTIIPQNGSIVQVVTGSTGITDLTGGTTTYTLNNGYINSVNTTMTMSEGFCIRFEVTTNGCHVGPLQLPDVVVSGTDVCGNSFTTPYTLPFIPSSGASNCTDCFSITKTAGSATAAPGDPVMFTITVCSNNGNGGGTPTVTLTDLFPQYFTPSPAITLPQTISFTNPISCQSVYVTGSYSDIGDCSDPGNVNTATITYASGSQSAEACMVVGCPDGGANAIHIDTDNDSQTLFGNSVSSATVVVHDNVVLTINSTFIIDNCTFIMGSGSMIEVIPGVDLTITNSLLYSCPQMWKGIRLAGGGATINMSNSTLKDAETGIYAQDKTNFKITDSQIIDCVTGIETEDSGGSGMNNITGTVTGTEFGKVNLMLKSGYAGQPVFGTVGRAGMLLNNIALTVGNMGNNENSFHDLNYGIEVHNSNVDVENNRFYDIEADYTYQNAPYNLKMPMGVAIAAKRDYDLPVYLNVRPLASGNTITNAPMGIYTNSYNATVRSVSMTDVIRGVQSTESNWCSVMVNDCNIHATYRGIEWMNNDGAKLMQAIGNTIVVERTSGVSKGGVCISMSEQNQGNNANYRISSNMHLETLSAAGGIVATGVENAQIDYNHVFINQGAAAAIGTAGISIYGGGRNLISCNGVSNTIPHSTVTTTGLDVNVSTNNRIQCNNLGTTISGSIGPNIGMRFGGNCAGTGMRGNTMRDNFVGLHLNNAGMIGAQTGTQTHNGNIWINYQNVDGAINDNIGFEYLSLFTVHTTMGINMQANPQYYPHLNNVNFNNGWFLTDLTGTLFSGCGTLVCNTAIVSGGGDDIMERMIAAGEIETEVYTDETKNMTEQYLFEKLVNDSVLLQADSLYSQFYDNKAVASTGKLYEVKQELNMANSFTPQQETTLALADSLIKIKLDSITALDSANAINAVAGYEVIREGLINGMNTLNGVITAIMQQHKASADSIYTAAAYKNSAVLPAELPETNHKLMNEMVLQYKAGGRPSVEGNYTALLAIAQQCPYAGGPAVYNARAMLELVNDTLEYYDDAVCLLSGIYRQGNDDKAKTETSSGISIIPNPASEQIEVRINGKLEGLCHITIINMLGEKAITDRMACESRSKKINISGLAAGVYTVRVQNNSMSKTAKLVISR